MYKGVEYTIVATAEPDRFVVFPFVIELAPRFMVAYLYLYSSICISFLRWEPPASAGGAGL